MGSGKYERKEKELVCSKCGETFTVKLVRGSICRKCQKKENDRRYYENNKDKWVERLQREEVKEKKKEIDRRYYEKNKEELLNKMKTYYEENKDIILAKAEKRRRLRGEKKKGLSGTEKIALKCLRELFPNVEIRCHDRRTVRSYLTGQYLELDFYIPSLSLAIELNGITHYKPIYGKEKFERQQRNDEVKREVCKSMGIRLIEIPLEEGVHYDRYDHEHKKLQTTLERFIRLREDKNAEDYIWEVR